MADLDAVADELYALAPAQFVAARADVVAAARAAGDKGVASALSTLRKPTLTAWLCNQLVRTHPDVVAAAIALGPELRDATVAGDRDALRSLARRRTELLTELVGHARVIADGHDQAMTAGTQRELESTFTAAAADPAAAELVLAGRLTTALTFEGFGFEQGALPPQSDTHRAARSVSRATTPRAATPRVAAVGDRSATTAPSTQSRDHAAEQAARAAVEEADNALAVARLQQADADAEVAEAERVLQAALQDESDAAAAYRDAQAAVASARAEVQDATTDAEAADRRVVAALAALEKATNACRDLRSW